jgi:hypothetical protein
LTGTTLPPADASAKEGRFAIRICVLSFRTHLDRMRQGLEDIRQSVVSLD